MSVYFQRLFYFPHETQVYWKPNREERNPISNCGWTPLLSDNIVSVSARVPSSSCVTVSVSPPSPISTSRVQMLRRSVIFGEVFTITEKTPTSTYLRFHIRHFAEQALGSKGLCLKASRPM